jgi:RNA polymerase sigma-70 factor (ECF subfamily)
MDDSPLLARAVAGDRAAFAELIARYYPMCVRVASRLLRNRDDAEDAVQDACLRALRHLPRQDPAVPFRAWLLRILINHCHTRGKERSRRERRFATDEAGVERAVARGTEPGTDLDRIVRAVEALPPLLREAFLLKHVEELEYREMAMATGASIPALKMRVKRACEALRPELEQIYRD